MIGKKLGKKLARRRNRAIDRITIATTPWDLGASGPANRHGLELEDAADVDPVTGKVVNPNGVKRARRVSAAESGFRAGMLDAAHVVYAREIRAMAEGVLAGAGDPLAAMSIKAPAGTPSEPLAARFDRRRAFMSAWGKIPHECRPEIEAVVLDDKGEHEAFGGKLCDILEGYAKIRVGLMAAFGGEE